MSVLRWSVAPILVVAIAALALAQEKRRDAQKPLVLARQGSFFVGGETKTFPAPPSRRGGFGAGDITATC